MGALEEAINPKYYYSRHQPEKTSLYQIIQSNLTKFIEQVEAEKGYPLPNFVIKEFYDYLDCGILAKGFLRLHCEGCGADGLVAFSCKHRGFCPSCGGRRMNETATHLVASVLPHQRIRQWVMSFPIPIRLLLSVKPDVMGKVLNIVNQCISKYYRTKAGLTKKECQTGAVTLIQRFGGSINLNVHFHSLYIDGAYQLNSDQKPHVFCPIAEPTIEELTAVLQRIIKKIISLLEKHGYLIRDNEDKLSLSIDNEDTFSQIQASSVVYRFATGPNRGKRALVLKTTPTMDHASGAGLVAVHSGFSLHAGVAVDGGERKKLEKLARYIARPPIAQDRLRLNEQGQVVYELKKPYRDGTSHIVMSPLELLEKITAIIPRPRVHLTRFHGVLAPHYKYRDLVVPKKVESLPSLEEDRKNEKVKSMRASWARLLKRVFDVDVETCGVCGGKVKIIAAIKKPEVIRKILDHIGMPSVPPEIASSRGPPSFYDDEFSHDTCHTSENVYS